MDANDRLLFEIRFRDLKLDSEGPPLEEPEDLVREVRRRRYEAEVRGRCSRRTPMGRDKKERGRLSGGLVLRGHLSREMAQEVDAERFRGKGGPVSGRAY